MAAEISQSPQDIVQTLGAAAKNAAGVLSQISEDKVNAVLGDIAKALKDNVEDILTANAKDIAAAKQRGLTDAMIDRLRLDESRVAGIAGGVETVQSLPDPVGRVLWEEQRPNGLHIQRVAVPIGVLGMIYESRPNVTVDAAALCLKSRNAVILRGGSESLHSSLALHAIIQDVLKSHNIPEACVSMIPTSDREAVGAMLAARDYIDVMIPRGGKGLIERVMNEAQMPVFSHLDGICHIYIHKSADPEIAVEVPYNAKLRRTGICGAMETLLIDRALLRSPASSLASSPDSVGSSASSLAASLAQDTEHPPSLSALALWKIIEAGCEVVGDEEAQKIDPRISAASAEDWSTEYLDARLSVKFVDGLDEAITHINTYGSHHTDSILAEDEAVVREFLARVDSGIVMHNASTQFADGGEFGMGAEIGIATGKMHARGPVGLEQLCTYKYIVLGSGQTRP